MCGDLFSSRFDWATSLRARYRARIVIRNYRVRIATAGKGLEVSLDRFLFELVSSFPGVYRAFEMIREPRSMNALGWSAYVESYNERNSH